MTQWARPSLAAMLIVSLPTAQAAPNDTDALTKRPLPMPGAPVVGQSLVAAKLVTPTIGPDARNLRFEWSGRLSAAAGGDVVLWGGATRWGRVAIALGGLLVLENDDAARAPVPYQLLRAHIELGVYFASPWHLRGRFRIRMLAGVSYDHESDHPSSPTSQTYRRLAPSIDVDNFSSFEAIQSSATLEVRQSRTTGAATITWRAFTPPVNPGAGRAQQHAVSFELRGEHSISATVGVFGAAYGEVIAHALTSSAVGGNAVPDRFSDARVQAGLTFGRDERRMELFAGYVAGDGRGLDFLTHYQAWIVGLRANR